MAAGHILADAVVLLLGQGSKNIEEKGTFQVARPQTFPFKNEVNKFQHKRAFAITARKLVRVVFRLLKDSRLYIVPKS